MKRKIAISLLTLCEVKSSNKGNGYQAKRYFKALVKLLDRIEVGNNTLIYKVVEENAKEGYNNIFYNKYIKLTVQVTSGVATSVEAKVFNNDETEDTSLNSKVSAEIIDVENVKDILMI